MVVVVVAPTIIKISTRQGELGGVWGVFRHVSSSETERARKTSQLGEKTERVSSASLYVSSSSSSSSFSRLDGDEWWGRGWCERCLWRTASLAVEGVTWRHLAERSPCLRLARARARPRLAASSWLGRIYTH